MTPVETIWRAPADERPLVAHVVFSFAVGGLENGVVNLINRMPVRCYRHAIISLTGVSLDFARRIEREDVGLYALNKPVGHAWRVYSQLHRLFADLAPAVVHTRNLAALEAQLPAWFAGVPGRVHGEHGWDVGNIDGSNQTHRLLRRAFRPFVHRYVALSKHLAVYLTSEVGIPLQRLTQIYNGVDLLRFRPASGARPSIPGCPFVDPELWLVGTVGRMQRVKNQVTFARAFVELCTRAPAMRNLARLVLVGDGPLRSEVESVLMNAGLQKHVWLAGERRDVPEILRGLDCFVLPSLAEGISNTILEAMASGLPVVATNVGGNAELVESGHTGELVPAGDASALAGQMQRYLLDRKAAKAIGRAGRARIEHAFGLDVMVEQYMRVYDELVDGARTGVVAGSRRAAS